MTAKNVPLLLWNISISSFMIDLNKSHWTEVSLEENCSPLRYL